MSDKPAPVVVVTGASAGVGRATAIEFGRHGYCVGLIARGHDGLHGASREVKAAGGHPLVLPADVADADAVFAAAARAVSAFGRIDVWVNDAMATVFSPVEAITPEEFRRVTEVTYLGQVYGTMAALKYMRPANRGTIVQVGSALSYRAIPLQSAYCGAKFAIRGFTDALRSEMKHDRSRVRLTMVQLPAVNTPQFNRSRNHLKRRPQPVPPIYQPEVIAKKIFHASITAPRELWIGHSALKAILGTMMLPGLGDRILANEGYAGQLTAEAADPNRSDNLFDPLPGDAGSRGRFNGRALKSVTAFNPRLLRVTAACAIVGVLVGALALGRSR